MCYVPHLQLAVSPTESFKILRQCSGCGGKSLYENTHRFRANANGKALDIWLIYQCTTCKHTYNLTLYERVRPERLNRKDYDAFLANDRDLAVAYGTDKSLFQRNKAEIQWQEVQYTLSLTPVSMIERTSSTEPQSTPELTSTTETCPQHGPSQVIHFHNPYGLKLRPEKCLAEATGLSRSIIQGKLDSGEWRLEDYRTKNAAAMMM